MRKPGERGLFSPPRLSPFGYNESLSQEYMPLSRAEAEEKGFLWREEDEKTAGAGKVIAAADLPDSLADTPDDVMHWVMRSVDSDRLFRVTRQELAFYRNMSSPLPRLHPDERYVRRTRLRNPRSLWNRPCSRCAKPMQTTYAPDRSEVVYCAECYRTVVY